MKNYFKELAEKAKKMTNSQEALKIRNRLIKIGILLLIIGGIGILGCFIALGISINNIFDDPLNQLGNTSGFGSVFMIMFLFIPCGFVVVIGGISLSCGLGITIAKGATNFLDNNRYCPYCGDLVKDDELFCNNCGKALLQDKICKKCGTENDLKSSYCKNCGNKLN